MALKPIGVSQLNDYLSRVIGSDPIMSNVLIKGEASGVKYHYTGHVYFSLVDGASKLNCFLHRLQAPHELRLVHGQADPPLRASPGRRRCPRAECPRPSGGGGVSLGGIRNFDIEDGPGLH